MDVNNSHLEEVLEQLKKISNSVVSSDYLKAELGHLKENTDLKVSDLKEDINELKTDFKLMHQDFSTIENSLNEFKTEMAPIIDFKKQVQTQIIKFSALAFTTLLALSIGMGQV
jgi:septation ring formation regulator EzrA